jgi:hypothetical protein
MLHNGCGSQYVLPVHLGIPGPHTVTSEPFGPAGMTGPVEEVPCGDEIVVIVGVGVAVLDCGISGLPIVVHCEGPLRGGGVHGVGFELGE